MNHLDKIIELAESINDDYSALEIRSLLLDVARIYGDRQMTLDLIRGLSNQLVEEVAESDRNDRWRFLMNTITPILSEVSGDE